MHLTSIDHANPASFAIGKALTAPLQTEQPHLDLVTIITIDFMTGALVCGGYQSRSGTSLNQCHRAVLLA